MRKDLPRTSRRSLKVCVALRIQTRGGINNTFEAAENDWHLPQQPPDDSIQISTKQHYGFLDMYTGYFTHVSHTENEINELGIDLEKLTPYERRERRVKRENEKWDEDHYMCALVHSWHTLALMRCLHLGQTLPTMIGYKN